MASIDESPQDKLRTYRAKRSADRTPEPYESAGVGPRHIFVVQKHSARRLHYDLRLEHEGVLLSWAVPAGPSLDTSVKRLAIRTEDHPIEYATFEGVIPAGEYGGGEMIVWDRGTFEAVEDIADGLEKGKLWFTLHGYKMRGAWILVRTKSNPKEWLLIKKPDGWERTADDDAFREESVFSGQLVEDLAASETPPTSDLQDLVDLRARPERLKVSDIDLMLARVAETPFSKDGWIFEIKYDGYRMLAAKDGDTVTLSYRSGIDATDVFPEIVDALTALPYPYFVVDGEVVVLSRDGKPSFSRLQSRGRLSNRYEIAAAAAEIPATFFGFDLLGLADLDLRPVPLKFRKAALRDAFPTLGPLRYIDHIETVGKEMFGEVEKMGLEGVMAKNATSPYRGGRSAEWLKMRVERTGQFVIVGYTFGKGNRSDIGALHIAARSVEGLRYAGRVGSGFSGHIRRSILDELNGLVQGEPPAVGIPDDVPESVWVTPSVVIEVRYKELTQAGNLRQPVFVALVPDASIDDVQTIDEAEPRHQRDETALTTTVNDEPSTNTEKIFWPGEGFTKGDLLAYYAKVSDHLLPYLIDRPIVLDRYPDGIDGKAFFQKNAPHHTPRWVRTQWIGESDTKGNRYFICDDAETLRYIINSATIPIHLWASRVTSEDNPDWCILDLDPKEANFSSVVVVANAIRELCDRMGLPSYPKTSGKSGLHVLIPMGRRFSYEQQKLLGEVVARIVESQLPDIATTIRLRGQRGGRVYIDFLQNGKGKLLVSPYSVRPVPGATVSAPLRWSEVTAALDVSRFTIRSMPRRIAALRDDPLLHVLSDDPDIQAGLARLTRTLSVDG
ncbi:MAG: DNA ligase D [Acidimicrobiia bacterium]